MQHAKDNVLVFSILLIMVGLTCTYLIGLSIMAFITFNEITKKYDELDIVVIQAEPTEVKVEILHETVKEEKPVKKKAKTVSKKVDPDVYLLAQIISAEAKGEPYKGMVAVGNVILNRVEHPKFPDTIKDVIFQKGQFQPVSNGDIYKTPSDDAMKAAKDVLGGKKVVSNDAIYFYNPDISTSQWIFTRQVIQEIGNHAFAS